MNSTEMPDIRQFVLATDFDPAICTSLPTAALPASRIGVSTRATPVFAPQTPSANLTLSPVLSLLSARGNILSETTNVPFIESWLAVYLEPRPNLEEQARCLLSRDILASLDQKPVEAGYIHPAEAIIHNALDQYGKRGIAWIEELYQEQCETAPAVAADLLVCVGHLSVEDAKSWGLRMAEIALHHRSVNVREAGVRALESWAAPQSVQLLTTYAATEPCGWLADYARQIIDDLAH